MRWQVFNMNNPFSTKIHAELKPLLKHQLKIHNAFRITFLSPAFSNQSTPLLNCVLHTWTVQTSQCLAIKFCLQENIKLGCKRSKSKKTKDGRGSEKDVSRETRDYSLWSTKSCNYLTSKCKGYFTAIHSYLKSCSAPSNFKQSQTLLWLQFCAEEKSNIKAR